MLIRPAGPADADRMAQVVVRSWRETYRGLMPDSVLDDPGLLDVRRHFWTAALTDPRYRHNTTAVAEQGTELIGVAMSGPPLDPDPSWTRQLYVLYVLESCHGTGAGSALLDAVLDPADPAALWVADPNPRAQAFYTRHGFVRDGVVRHESGVDHVRMVRPAPLSGG